MPDLLLAIGLLGAFMQLVAYALNIFGKISHESVSYISANALGCVLTSYYAITMQDFPFLILEIAWGSVAFYKLFWKFAKK